MKVKQKLRFCNDLPLFEWADRHPIYSFLPLSARRLRQRHGLTPAAALVVAREAGFPVDGGYE